MVLIIKVVRQICSSCAAVKWITLRGIYLDSFSVSFVHHPCHWHPCCDGYLAASKIQTLCKSSEGTIVNFKETWMWKEVNIIKTKTKTKTKGSLDTKKKTDRLKELCINEVQLPPIKQILSEKRDFFFPLWIFLTPSTAGRLQETPKAVARISPSLTVFKPSVKSHLATKQQRGLRHEAGKMCL